MNNYLSHLDILSRLLENCIRISSTVKDANFRNELDIAVDTALKDILDYQLSTENVGKEYENGI